MQTDPLQGNRLADELSSLEKIQFVAKLGAAALPLTYVSGYLIATSYLGTYGIHPDASDLFRSKYIYIGFLYLIFFVFMASLTWLIIQTVVTIFGPPREIEMVADELKQAGEELDSREKKTNPMHRLLSLRWHIVVALILFVFTFEIVLLDPNNMGLYLPAQVVFLLGIFLYQASYYPEIYRPYTWGLIHGKTYVEHIRWTLFWSMILMVFSLVITAILSIAYNSHRPPKWIIGVFTILPSLISIAMQLLATCSIFVREKGKDPSIIGICDIDSINNHWFEPIRKISPRLTWQEIRRIFLSCAGCWSGYSFVVEKEPKRKWILRIGVLSLTGLFAIYLWPFVWPGFLLKEHPKFNSGLLVVQSGLLGGLALLLSLAVLANVLYFTFMYTVRSKELGPYKAKVPENSVLGYSAHLIIQLLRDQDDARKKQAARWEQNARRTILVAILYSVSVLGFAYLVYPHIPVQKAGGNYSTAPRVTIQLVSTTPTGRCPSDIPVKHDQQPANLIIEEDSNWVYFANDGGPEGPRAWSWPKLGQKPARPKVWAVNRSCIASHCCPN